MKQKLMVGTYSEPILFGTGELFCGKGEGLYLCEFDGERIEILHKHILGNPSYLAVDEDAGKIYAVNEMKEFRGEYGGGLTEVNMDENGGMETVRSFATQGGDPCHVALSPDGRFVCVANFADGVVTVFRRDGAGQLLPDKQVFRHEGSSVHPVRQRGPHAHSVIFDGRGRMFVPDLGMDRLMCYDISDDIVVPDEAHAISVAPGNGPRFGEFSPDGGHFYLINELGSSVTHFLWDGEQMTERETVTTLPEDFTGDNICSDLHITPDGKYLFASNRGHDSIVSYRIDENGALHMIERVSCGGRTPRNFAIDPTGTYLFVGNQDSDTIVVFEIGANGQLSFISKNEFPTPVCICFLKKM